uniref:Uncharacterized protein n=1 Tax=Fagus sylvatica TaxID=28930 RepID=A0A2N9J272_FAGSY
MSSGHRFWAFIPVRVSSDYPNLGVELFKTLPCERAPATPGSFGKFDSTSQWLAWLGLRIQIFCVSRHWLRWLFLKSTGLGSSFVLGIMYFGLFVVVLVVVGMFLL